MKKVVVKSIHKPNVSSLITGVRWPAYLAVLVILAVPVLSLAATVGDFWEYKWDTYDSSWSTGKSETRSEDSGRFRVTLGPSKQIEGMTAYEVLLSGRFGFHKIRYSELAPRWKYLVVQDDRVLGSEDGTTLVLLFDAQLSSWQAASAGFFSPLTGSFTAEADDIVSEYISGQGIRVEGRTASEESEYEYYIEGLGPVVYYYRYYDAGHDYYSGLYYAWSYNHTYHIGLVASSLRGDIAPEWETESNNSPETAQLAHPPTVIIGDASVGEGTPVNVNMVEETESNDSAETAQNLEIPSLVTGDASDADPYTHHINAFEYQGTQYPMDIQDFYVFTLASQALVTIRLDWKSPTADLDLALFNATATESLGFSVKDNPDLGDPYELIELRLDSGTYVIGIDAYNTPDGSVEYTLDIGYKGSSATQEVEDWYKFTLSSQVDITCTLNFEGYPTADLDLYLLNDAADTVLASSLEDNPATGDPNESIETELGPGTYFIGVDAFAVPDAPAEYTFVIEGPSMVHLADTGGDYEVGDFELLDYIDLWANGQVEDFDLLDTIDLWAAGHYYWDASAQKFKPGTQP